MTIALALDTSGPVGSVAVVRQEGDERRVLANEVIEKGMKHGVELFPALERVLAESRITVDDLDLVAVGTGPGSYTGLRVGVTAARGLAYAAHRPLLGVPSCDAWARATPVREATLAVVLDSRTKEVYLAVYRAHGDEWRRDGEPTVLDPGAASSRIPDDAVLVGDGAAAYPQQLGEHRHLDSPNRAEATDVARLALERHGRGERQKVDDVVPLYLRRSEAELRWERTHG